MRPSLLVLTAIAVVLASPGAWGAPVVIVKHSLVKVGVDKVLRVSLAEQQPAVDDKRVVVVTVAATYPKCAGGEAMSYKEGTWDAVDYISYWTSEADDCPPGGPVDLQHTMTLPVGRAYSFVFRGARKFDQKVGFRVEKEKVASVLIKKILQR